MTDNECLMLGLFEHRDNRVQLYVGVGWNDTPAPALPDPFDNRGYYRVGLNGVCYQVGGWQIWAPHPLRNPFLAVYDTGRHHEPL
jgi:hypothetical protein